MTDGSMPLFTPPIKHDDKKKSSFGDLIIRRLMLVLIAVLMIVVIFVLPVILLMRVEYTTEEDIKVMILDKSEYSYGEAEYCSIDDYYYFNPNEAETELSVLIEYDGEQYVVHGTLLHSKAKVGEYFDAVLVTDHYSNGSINQHIRFDLGGDHEN